MSSGYMPEDYPESYPCSSDCPDGTITFNEGSGMWECDTCDFETPAEK